MLPSGSAADLPAVHGREPPIVGRDGEIAAAERAIADTFAGRGRLILLSGAPGIGKTRLAFEIGRCAELRGSVVAWGRCVDGAVSPEYWPWHEVWKALQRSERVPCDFKAALLAVSERWVGLPLEYGFAVRQVFGDALHNATSKQPVTIVIENLHSADIPSLLLFEFLSQMLCELPLLLVGTFRPKPVYDDALRLPAIARVLRTATALSFELQGLPPREAARLLNLICPGSVDGEVAGQMHRLTAGNPFLLTQLASSLSAEVPISELAATLPPAVEAAIKDQLDSLDTGTRTMLAEAASFDGCIDAECISKQLGRPRANVLGQLNTAAKQGVLVRISGLPASFTFTQELLRAWLRAGAVPGNAAASKESPVRPRASPRPKGPVPVKVRRAESD